MLWYWAKNSPEKTIAKKGQMIYLTLACGNFHIVSIWKYYIL